MNNDYTIKENNLKDIGIDLTGGELTSLLEHLNEELSGRVGEAILRELSDEQIDQYNEISKTADEDTIEKWMSKQIPDFEQIVQDEIDTVLNKLADKVGEFNKT